MGLDDLSYNDIIRQEFAAMGFLRMPGVSGAGLTDAGKILMNGGMLDSNYDYNVFNNNISLGSDTSYMGIMYNYSNGGSSSYSFINPNLGKVDWSQSTFDLNHTYGNAIAVSGAGIVSGNNDAGNNNNTGNSGASYKFVQDTDGSYKAEYTINGKKAKADEYREAVGYIAFNKIQEELKDKNKKAS